MHVVHEATTSFNVLSPFPTPSQSERLVTSTTALILLSLLVSSWPPPLFVAMLQICECRLDLNSHLHFFSFL